MQTRRKQTDVKGWESNKNSCASHSHFNSSFFCLTAEGQSSGAMNQRLRPPFQYLVIPPQLNDWSLHNLPVKEGGQGHTPDTAAARTKRDNPCAMLP